MWDGAYLIITLSFFGLMIAYVAACARLGRGHGDTSDDL